MGFRLTVDTGGTFTDLVLATDDELVGYFKSPTTPADMFEGIQDGIAQAAESQGLSVGELLAETSTFVYSSTHGTNAILEGKTAKTAFVTTAGHGDMLVYREGGKPDPFNLRIPYPKPYVPRSLTFEVPERVLSDGTVHEPLDEGAVEALAGRLEDLAIEAVGVCLLWSVVNSSHEERVGELLEERLPDVDVSLSSQVNPIIREFRRASATVIDASLKPLMRRHLLSVDSRLRELGYQGDALSVTHVSGGMRSLRAICEAPLQSVDSGPALGPVAGATLARAELDTDEPDAIVTDLGGTSFDISVIHGGDLTYTREKWLGPQFLGHPTGMHAVDTHSVSAGGGSIARVDEGGVLSVGPDSAGADPGPVCYGRGGTLPTVTDAAAAVGYLEGAYFAQGRFELDIDGAAEAVQTHVGEQLGLNAQEAGAAILAVATEAMRSFIHDQTVRQGLDPRSCLLISGGGAAGLNIVSVARELGVSEILVPSGAGVLCAIGGQYADVVSEFSRRHFTTTSNFDHEGVAAVIAELEDEIEQFFARLERGGEPRREFVCEARYADQNWEIDVPLSSPPRLDSTEGVADFAEEFHRVHKRLFAVDQPGQSIECINWRARARHVRPKPGLPRFERSDASATPVGSRSIWEDGDWVQADVFDGTMLEAGTEIQGVAVIEEPTTTVVIPSGARAVVTPHGNYLIDVDVAQSWPGEGAAVKGAQDES